MTTIINLLGGAGCGKSTLASRLFFEMKTLGYNVELIKEYAKEKHWRGEPMAPINQLEISGEQTRRELELIDKVDYIITDSPIFLSHVYYKFYTDKDTFLAPIEDYIADVPADQLYLTLNRTKAFNPVGRNETETQSVQVDNLIRDELKRLKIPSLEITTDVELKHLMVWLDNKIGVI